MLSLLGISRISVFLGREFNAAILMTNINKKWLISLVGVSESQPKKKFCSGGTDPAFGTQPAFTDFRGSTLK
jgi:hypothetical protein